MVRNNLKIALRNLRKHAGYTFINVSGLAVGMAACLFILLYVRSELSYDDYHIAADRLYRVNLHGRLAGHEVSTANTCAPMAAALKSGYREVVNSTRLDDSNQDVLVTTPDNRSYHEARVMFADSTFFDLFSIAILDGDPRTALSEPYSVVLSKASAAKYFGDENPIGQSLTFNGKHNYKVTAITENVPENTHFHYDLLASFVTLPRHRRTQWVGNNLATYVLLAEGAQPKAFEAKLAGVVRKYVGPEIKQAMGLSLDEFFRGGGGYRYTLERVTQIHLGSRVTDNFEPVSNPAYVTSFALVAVFILLLACVNFMNLSTARSANRAKEVGIRKVVGSNRNQLVRQFLLESFLLSALAMLLAVLLLEFFLPNLNLLAGKQLETDYLHDWTLLPILLGMTILVGLAAGAYPAGFLAAFRPVQVLKGELSRGARKSGLRNTLVVFQFAVSIVLLIGTLGVGQQLNFMRNKKLGFDKQHVLLVKRATALGEQLDTFQNDVRQLSSVVTSAGTWHVPGNSMDQNAFKLEGAENEAGFLVNRLTVGYGFVETLDMDLVDGRSFSREFGTDSTAYVINEAAMRKFGWQNGLGKTIYEVDDKGPIAGKVIGVLRDFHFRSLHSPIEPALLRLRPWARFVAIRIHGDKVEETIQSVEAIWNVHAPEQPFSYSFLNDDFDALYRADQRVGGLFAVFSALGVTIACLGLFGLASFASEQRTKEIGVRKVLGATVPGIFMLLSREFTRLVLIAFCVAVPLGFYGMRAWLQGFAYRASLDVSVFLFAGLAALVIAWLTVSYQAIKAALRNPAIALKYE